MKKWLLALAGAVTLSLSGQALAQELNPDALFPVEDLGIGLPLPSTWGYQSSADGLYFAASQNDLAAATDGNRATVPAGAVIQLQWVPLSSISATPETPLTDIQALVASAVGFSPAADALSSAVLGHHALTTPGSINGANVLLTLWTQADTLAVLSLTTPQELSAFARVWGFITANIQALDALELTQTAASSYGFDIAYPQGWVSLNQEARGSFVVFEALADAQAVQAGSDQVQAATVVVSLNNFGALNLPADPTPQDLQPALEQLNLGSAEIAGEFFVNGQPGLGIYGQIPNGRWLFSVATLNAEERTVLFYTLSVPDEKALETLLPTFYSMLHSTNLNLN